MRIIFNGKEIEMEKQDPKSNDYKNGVQYIYKFVPNKLGSNFYYFEASNGSGKTRAAIIDSPDNGPVLFDSAFDKNEIAVVDSKTGEKILNFQTKEEWVGGIALSDDGKYLAAKTSNHIYLFDTQKPNKPLWEFQSGNEIGGDVKGGVAISGDGSRIFALIGSTAVLFDKNSNKPIWKTEVGNGYNVAISKDGKYMATGLVGSEENENSNLLILWSDKSEKPLWKYHSSGNFHDVSLSFDGSYIGASTGCPDRKAYIFSKDSNTPILKSEQLTRDSPVHRGKISADGNYLAVGSESDAGAIFLFKKGDQQPIWKFPTQNGSSVRALSFTPSGNYIGAATFGGQAYIFDTDKSSPVSTWVVNNTALGGVDIADDGTFIATGGTDKKLHIFEKGKTNGMEIQFNEYVEEIDISANGKYIAAGTGGSVYFFESFNKDQNKVFPCTTIIEPKSQENQMNQKGDFDILEKNNSLWEKIINFIKNLFV
ncbi:MAG: WD40 repeat domain-containing protein, partial [Candidatus Woesebacteria bacterium]|nr:WD40 repeat domain-containing protein [Candidatus Woesebacteria bacterium]